MVKEVKIGGKKCRLKSSAAVVRMYREKFKEDVIVAMNEIFMSIAQRSQINKEIEEAAKKEGKEAKKVSEDLLPEHTKTLENFAYILHKNGDPSQPDEITEWLEQFGLTGIYDIFSELIDIWIEENKQIATAKKKSGE